jgi:alpha 1,2-mannosyltransferase
MHIQEHTQEHIQELPQLHLVNTNSHPHVIASSTAESAATAPIATARKLVQDNSTANTTRANAAFVVLLQNKDLHDMRKTMRNLEAVFNRKHGYPYVFLNNVPFTEHFKTHIRAMTSAQVKFGKKEGSQLMAAGTKQCQFELHSHYCLAFCS